MASTTHRDAIIDLMRANAREKGGYRFTVPSPELYPFQWLWDSCFHAIIYSHFDTDAAKAEIMSALAKPLRDGILPHIIYWYEDYAITNWGRERRGDIINNAWGVNGTSSLTQPPIVAEAVRRILMVDNDQTFVEDVYPTLAAHYRALMNSRIINGDNLLGIINPDESGEDNSPRFDVALRLAPQHSMETHLNRRLALIENHVDCDFIETCTQEFFWVEDVPFNAIAVVGLRALAEIAGMLQAEEDAAEFERAAARIERGMQHNLRENGLYYSLDRTNFAHRPITTHTWALFMPLYAGIATEEEAEHLINHHLTKKEHFWAPFGIPTTGMHEPSFDRDNFWRGPTWMAANWFVFQGLRRYGYHELADELRHRSEALIAKSGFREYYDPLTGTGLGANEFTWGALVIDMD